MKKWKCLSRVWLFATPWTIQSMEFSRPEYRIGCHSLLQGIFPTQWSNPGLPHCRQILYQLNHQGSPRILKWVPIPSPADLPNPGIELGSPALQADSLQTELSGKPDEGEREWKSWLKTQHSKNSDRFYFSWAPKSLQMVTAAMKLKDACSLEEKLWQT